MRKLIRPLIFALLMIWLAPAVSYAGAAEDYAEAYKLRLSAAACLAAYSSRTGMLAREYLDQNGWEIIPFSQSSKEASARFVLARNLTREGQPQYVLAVVGTENFQDVKIDLQTGKVFFAGRTPEEFAAKAALKGVPDTAPKVHRGFHEYVQAGFMARKAGGNGTGEQPLGELLRSTPTMKIILTGHSLGGAAATVAGARLLAMGVKPEQVEVITFGAPAVGNEAFCRAFSPRLALTRVVIAGDPVTGVLQKLVGGYRQFGRELVWRRSPLSEQGPHAMAEYLDLAMKNFYDRRTAALRTGVPTNPPKSLAGAGERLYVAVSASSLPPGLRTEYPYMQQALTDQYRRSLPGCVMTGTGREALKRAAGAGNRWYVSAELCGIKLKNEPNQYVVALRHTVYDTVSGHVVYMNEYSSVTAAMTPLEAMTHNAAAAVADLAGWLPGGR